MNAPLIALSDLSLREAGVLGLDRFSLTLQAGECVVVLGEAGSGKDALTAVLGGFQAKNAEVSGTIRYGSGALQPAGRRNRAPIRIAYLPSPASKPFAPHASVLSQLCRVAARKLGAPLASAREELRLALERLEGAPPIFALNKPPSDIDPVTLSWGLLACVSVQTPDLVLADHPFADLGPSAVSTLLTALNAEHKRLGFALVYATGGLQPAARLAGRVLVIRDGRVVEEGDAARLSSGHAHSYTNILFKALPRLDAERAKNRSTRGQPLLQVHGLDLTPAKRARPQEGLTFELRRGAALALIGDEGSGRRALARAVLGLDRPGQGRVVFDAVDLGILSPAMTARLRRRIAFITGADDALDPRMTLWDTVEEPLRAHLGLAGDLIAGYRETALKRVGLASHDGRLSVAALSAFDRRRLQVARAIVGAPLLVVVDEPLRGLDAYAQAVMREVLSDFRAHQGPAFLVITADFTVAQALADEAFVFDGGNVVERGLVSEILKSPKHPRTKALIAAVTLPNLSPEAEAG